MYTELKTYQIIIALLKKYGITHCVLSAGSRNVPFVHSIEEDPDFHCYSVVDERSAGYFALGLAQELNQPVVISCTSSTATCNYWPPVAEAFYQGVPIVVLTSDRDPEMLGQWEDQMIDQVGMYDRHVRKSVNLPIINSHDDEIYCQRLVNEALLELNHHGTGPVHINVPMKSYNNSFNIKTLPDVTRIDRLCLDDADDLWKEKIEKQGKILLNLMRKYAHIKISTLLDCTCGIGIQAISLAQEGLNVTGSDISQNELNFAINEAQKRNLKISFTQADCRYLEQVFNNNFDAIISIDSALPHLITKENFILAFKSIYNRLNKGGVFLSSYRDYAELLKTKPNMAYPIRFNTEGDKEYTIFRKWKWDKDIIYSKQYVIVDTEADSKLYTNSYKQWAVTKSQLLAIARETRYSEIYWLLPEESQFSQPILCLVK